MNLEEMSMQIEERCKLKINVYIVGCVFFLLRNGFVLFLKNVDRFLSIDFMKLILGYIFFINIFFFVYIMKLQKLYLVIMSCFCI